MFQKREICSCRTVLDGNREYKYRYFLIEDAKSVTINENVVRVPSYGISVLREAVVNGNLTGSYEESLDTVSSSRTKVVDLIEYLKDNEVSPIHLIDIAGEMADEWVSDYEKDAKAIFETTALA